MRLTRLIRNGFAEKFRKFDYMDALNLKSQLTEEEIMVRIGLTRSWKMQDSLRRLNSGLELKLTTRTNLTIHNLSRNLVVLGFLVALSRNTICLDLATQPMVLSTGRWSVSIVLTDLH